MVVKVLGGTMHPEEQKIYVDRVASKFPGRHVKSITLTVDDEFVDIYWELDELPPFERIRRITGYLVGTLDRWNNGKLAEEHDRVKHGVEAE